MEATTDSIAGCTTKGLYIVPMSFGRITFFEITCTIGFPRLLCELRYD